MQITLYTKPDCPLCDDLKADLASLHARFEFTLVERNIEEDAGDFQRYRYLIPVLDIEGGPVLYPPFSWPGTVAALEDASREVGL